MTATTTREIHTRNYLSDKNLFLSSTSPTASRREGLAARRLFAPMPHGPQLVLRVSDVAPWMPDTLRTLEEIQGLDHDWDSYGGLPTSPTAVREALDVLTDVMGRTTPAPFVVPLPDGGLQFEWHLGSIDLEIELSADGSREVLYTDASTRHEEAFSLTTPLLGKVERILMELAHRARTVH